MIDCYSAWDNDVGVGLGWMEGGIRCQVDGPNLAGIQL